MKAGPKWDGIAQRVSSNIGIRRLDRSSIIRCTGLHPRASTPSGDHLSLNRMGVGVFGDGLLPHKV